MSLENFENIFALFCTIISLLWCLFKYIENQKRTYLYLVVYFLAHFLSDYYWTIYLFVMDVEPVVSGFIANLGWNIGFLVLFLAVLNLHKERNCDNEKRFFHPLMLWPVLTNFPLLLLYCRFGGILNNIWQVGLTTLVMILSTGDILSYLRYKKGRFPYSSVLILCYEIATYGMWTASCFDWKSESSNPYFYCEITASILIVIFAWSIGKEYSAEEILPVKKNVSELRFQTAIQTISSFVIFTLCIGGYFIASIIRNSLQKSNDNNNSSARIVFILFGISVILVLIILFLLYRLAVFQRKAGKKRFDETVGGYSKFNLIFTILFTFILMAFIVVYNTRNYYEVTVSGVIEDGENKVEAIAAHFENYLTRAETILRVTADSIDLMEQGGASGEKILQYLTDETENLYEQFDENFTGLYAYINGEYLDGVGWIPTEDYNPITRGWYKDAVAANGKLVITSPYVDAQTGSICITIAKTISKYKGNVSPDRHNVVCLDVIINHIKDVTENVDIAGKGFGMVINSEGYIISHRDVNYNGQYISNAYSPELFEKIVEIKNGILHTDLDGKECTIFVSPVMNQWYDLIVVTNAELFEDVRTQILANILGALVTFGLIAFFYYLGYKNEQTFGKKVDEMNINVVRALAAAIDAKDEYTKGHSSRVALYSKMIAERFGFNEDEQNEIYMVGLLHDVGKIGVPDGVINKPSKLTEEEFELIKKHPVIGNDILRTIKGREKLCAGARSHHERYDGKGYPDGLSGMDIPEEARIIAVADAYDAMTSRRSYREALPQKKVREEIEKGIGTQFDPDFAEVMIEMIDEDVDYKMHE